MKILIIGGTRFFGIHMVEELLAKGHDITIATRGKATDEFGNKVKRIILDRTNEMSIKFPYEGIKRQAEYALWQVYSDRNWIAVRYPFVIGKDDYTKRLLYYVEHTMKSIPMNIDNLDYQIGFIRSDEAGKFMAFLIDNDLRGAVNGSSKGTISIKEIIEYVERKTGTKAIIDNSGEEAPYNGVTEYSINTEKAEALGFRFSTLQDWIYKLLDYYIQSVV